MTKIDILAVWRAGRATRWHQDAWLSGSRDFLDGHHARVAKLILALWPDASRDLLVHALTHDDGEPGGLGDMAKHAKERLQRDHPAIAHQLDRFERDARRALWGTDAPGLSREDGLRLKLADRLDAYLWAKHHDRDMTRGKWPADREEIIAMADTLGVLAQVTAAMEG